ncbi:lipoyl(octanoyl) transferase [Apiospora arundinis]|uniref:Lipoyl(Octanoyl) transferase n=1 Tax=Apiospora arundinis TaxID=335852 RepID=A0ABR2HP64_9PEZI
MRPLQICIAPAECGILTPSRVNALHRALRHLILDGRTAPTPSEGVSPTAPTDRPAAALLAFQPHPSYRVPRAKDEDKVKSILQQGYQEEDLPTPDVTFSAHERAVYRGPGQLALWPVLDTKSSALSKLHNEDDAEKALADAAIAFLGRLYGSRGLGPVTHRPGLGLWVDSRHFRQPRQIADIEVFPREPELVEGAKEEGQADSCLISCRIDINLEDCVMGSPETDPWARLKGMGLGGQDTTSVAAELSADGKPSHEEALVTESAMKELGAALTTGLGLGKALIAKPEEAFGKGWRLMGYEEPEMDQSKPTSNWRSDIMTMGIMSFLLSMFD